jgi:hypothetical protein
LVGVKGDQFGELLETLRRQKFGGDEHSGLGGCKAVCIAFDDLKELGMFLGVKSINFLA